MQYNIGGLPDRIAARIKVNPVTGCWECQGKLSSGYARMGWAGRIQVAHRVVYTLLVGPIPDGLTLDHLCRVRHCVNPAHLEPVTRGTNVLRGIGPAALNAVKTHCPAGHEYNEVNTYIDSLGQRTCRSCHRVAEAARRIDPEVREHYRALEERRRARLRCSAGGEF